MNKLLLTIGSIMAIVMLSGCVTKYKEVRAELAFFPYFDCEPPKRMPLEETVVVGFDVEFMVTKEMFKNRALIVLPFPMKEINFDENMYLYSESGLKKYIKCQVGNKLSSKKNAVIWADNNSKVKPK